MVCAVRCVLRLYLGALRSTASTKPWKDRIQSEDEATDAEQHTGRWFRNGGGEEAVAAAGVVVIAHDLAGTVDPDGVGGHGAGEFDFAVDPAAEQEAVAVNSTAHDLAGIVDPGIKLEGFDIEKLRERLRKMTDTQLLEFGRAGRQLCSPEANLGKPPREVFVTQLEETRTEWRRRAKRKNSKQV